jgi:hypothetical protein
MLPVLILLCAQINPYGNGAAAAIIVPPPAVPSSVGALGAGLGGALGAAGGLEVDPALVYDPAVQTRGGLDEDYRLAQLLIARTLQRRMEAARLMAAAQGIELNNARLREYVCSRFCSAPAVGTQMPYVPPTPMYPTVDPSFGVDPLLSPVPLPQPLPYVPPRNDYDARYFIRHGGTVQVQVLPGYRRRY